MSKKPKKTQHFALIDDLASFIGRFVVLSDEQRLVMAVYVIHTHIAKRCQQTPYIFIHSPEPECGKSRLMEVLDVLVREPWMIVNPSDAVLFRKVNDSMPTLLWDEIDAVFNPKSAQYHEEQRGMLDQGHRRRGRVPRFIGDKVKEFDVYCPKVFAGIGTLPDTLSRRSIPISLKRRRPDEPIDEFIYQDVVEEAAPLVERVEAWAAEYGKTAANDRPSDLPERISDRMKEGCFSLFAIADLAGKGAELRKALDTILTGDRLDSQQTMRTRLLRDLRTVFAMRYRDSGKPMKFLPTDEILESLIGFEESPWSDYYGRELEAKDLATLLEQYGVKSRQVKYQGEPRRGYSREPSKAGDVEGLADVWTRYLGEDDTQVVIGSRRDA
ncbi:DUF3631 domain-containing protein [Nocardioides caricicola]|uniref:DUF3631 domain-containing protein n=1 Tax=Nocardioides caricicola TaxID=634770 RepID=A0ABW0N384_9ACTN